MYDMELHIAVVRNDLRTVDRLTKSIFSRGKINKKGENDMTIFMGACGNGFTEIVQLLLKRGAKVNVRSIHGSSPLSLASNGNFINVGILLLRHGASLEFAVEPYLSDILGVNQITNFVNMCRSLM